ncbi:MAG: transglutaminase, partial [Clostridiaceae bacterium]|nr:transglutaminase [Clostridiaceae bacterium]
MKTRLVVLTVLVVMLIGILGVPVVAETPASSKCNYGDITNDGKINSTDYSFLKRYLLGITEPTNSDFFEVADLNVDGKVNSTDYSVLKRYILGIIDALPYKPSIIDTTPPSKPTGLNYLSVTGTTVSIYWEASSSNDVKYYAVYNNDKFVELTEGATEYNLTGLVPNVKYELKVCAIDTSNNISEFSNICSVTTKVNNINEIKKALLYNFSQKGTTYSLTYCGDIADIENEVNQAILEAVNESNEPFMLTGGVSWGANGSLGNLQITFTFPYDNENQYMAVARSTEDLKKVVLSGLYNRDQNINIIYKGELTESDIRSVKESVLNNDTYLKYCLEDFNCNVVSDTVMGISALRFNCNYKTTQEQEEYIDSTVGFIVSKLTNSDMTDDEKEKLIHDYILTNIEYFEDEKYGNAYSALYYGKTKCDGY